MDGFHRGFERLIELESQLSSDKHNRDVFSAMICGGVAGIVAKTAVAPAERVKMSFQVSSKDLFTLEGALQRGSAMVKEGGVLSLWKGHSTTIVRVAPYAGLCYAAHDYTERKFKVLLKTDTLPFVYKFTAGSVGGAVGTLLTYPLDVLRVRIALIPNSNWSSAIRQGGLYQGLAPTMFGIIPYSGTSWMVKQTLQELFPKVYHRKPLVVENLVLNAIAGLSAQLVTYPLDIVRRRMQVAAYEPNAAERMTIQSMLQRLLKEEGVKGLTKGFSLNIIKGPITLSLSLTTYDYLRDKRKQILMEDR